MENRFLLWKKTDQNDDDKNDKQSINVHSATEMDVFFTTKSQ